MTEKTRKVTSKYRTRTAIPHPSDESTACKIRFQSTLRRPQAPERAEDWTFLVLPQEASDRLPSRGMTSVEGRFADVSFCATLNPDGKGGHWLKVEPPLREAAGVEAGDVVAVEMTPVAQEPEPRVPAELQDALTTADPKAQAVWSDITPAARRDWVHCIESSKREQTRLKRIETACDMLSKGKRRPCCFDRSGMYSKSLSCPVAEEAPTRPRQS